MIYSSEVCWLRSVVLSTIKSVHEPWHKLVNNSEMKGKAAEVEKEIEGEGKKTGDHTGAVVFRCTNHNSTKRQKFNRVPLRELYKGKHFYTQEMTFLPISPDKKCPTRIHFISFQSAHNTQPQGCTYRTEFGEINLSDPSKYTTE